jgi:hypothetical protein
VIDLALTQRFEQVDAHGRKLDLAGVGLGLRQQIKRQRVVGIAEPGYRDGATLQIANAFDLPGGLRRGHQREQRQPAGHRKALDRGALVEGGDGDVERGRRIVDRIADQRLHRGAAAARIDQFDVEPVLLEVAGGARDLVRHATQQLAAIGELDAAALRLGRAWQGAGDDGRALQKGAAGKISRGYAGGGFVAAAHRDSPNLKLMSRPIRRNAAAFLFCSRNMKEFPTTGHNGGMFVYGGRPISRLYFTLGRAPPLPKPAHCRNRCKPPDG